jgi:hypothetical protein
VQSIIYIRTLAVAAAAAATGISFRLSFALCSCALVSNNRTSSADRIITARATFNPALRRVMMEPRMPLHFLYAPRGRFVDKFYSLSAFMFVFH